MFNQVEGEVLDTVTIGPKKNPGTSLRLIKTKKNNLLIQSWNNIGNAWTIMYRYGDIQKQWDSWKKIEASINDRKKTKRKPVGSGSKRKPKN
jgi:hypothetical protein